MNSHDTKYIGRRLLAALLLGCLGTLATSINVQAAVSIDQTPLTVQPPLAPNLVLMFDDSGSMAWDVMPDYDSLSSKTQEALIDSDVNGVYYNPTVIYLPPPKSDGTLYPNADFGAARVNGFDTSSNTVNLGTYRGAYDTYNVNYVGTPVQYSISVAVEGAANYSPASSCPEDTKISGSAQPGYCYFTDNNNVPSAPFSFFDVGNGYFYVSRCDNIEDKYTYSSSGGTCAPGRSFFTFTTSNSGGGYTRHYVAQKAGDCAAVGLSSAVCDESDATRQNVANWYSYYHTRILTAKSGLMSAFSTLSPTTRLGFGSINGNNNGGLPSPTVSYNSTKIAEVQPFGDGDSGSQKDNFWGWVIGENANSSTPLRRALQAVGEYYQVAQPWQTSSSDTTELACRQSYTILTTDGFWNGGAPSGIGDADSTEGPLIKGSNSQKYQYEPVQPYEDDNSDTLADVAMHYWETDLRPSTANEVPPSAEDPAFWQHMTTFTLGLGFTPSGINPSGTTIEQIFTWANGGTPINNFSWPEPASNSINNIADLAHAAVDGHGAFESATSPQALASGLEDALKRVASRVGTGASLAANSTKLQTGTVTYQALYYTGKWKGDLKAYAVDPSTSAISTTATWTASEELPAWSSRKVYFNPTGTSTLDAFDAADLSDLSAVEKSALGTDTTSQTATINYLLGDNSNEQSNSGAFRNRDTPLGDIVDSQPVYVGAPNANAFYNQSFTGSGSFASFASTNTSRTPLIWVAANDGMVHAFDAGTGVETFAYLPSAVITNGISNLSNPNYGGSSVPHQYYNDGELTVADVYLGSTWHTVLVGTTGRGPAKAVYALDVTNPATPSLLWERSASDGGTNSKYIGQIVGKPIIAQTADGTWSVLIGNGYNSASGTAALLQFNLTTGALTAYPTDATTNNGLAAPAVWIGTITNDVSTTAYAGDLNGNVWSFDLTHPGHAGTLLFTAQDSAGHAQPITGGMLASKDPSTGNVWLFFGTGQYLTQSDLANTSTQTWYGLIVQATDSGSTLVGNLQNGRLALIQRSIIAETAPNPSANPPTLGSRVITPGTTGDTNGKSGWYIDLTSPTAGAQGERMVTSNEFQGSLLIGTTRIPLSSDPCNPSGSGWIMAINPFTGTNPTTAFFDLNNDGLFNDSDRVTVNGKQYASAGVGFNSIPNNPIFVGNTMLTSFDNGTTSSVSTAGNVGAIRRVSWRELVTQ